MANTAWIKAVMEPLRGLSPSARSRDKEDGEAEDPRQTKDAILIRRVSRVSAAAYFDKYLTYSFADYCGPCGSMVVMIMSSFYFVESVMWLVVSSQLAPEHIERLNRQALIFAWLGLAQGAALFFTLMQLSMLQEHYKRGFEYYSTLSDMHQYPRRHPYGEIAYTLRRVLRSHPPEATDAEVEILSELAQLSPMKVMQHQPTCCIHIV